MDHEAAILAAADDFAFHVESEMGGFIEGGMERAERDDDATWGRIIEIEFAVGVESIGQMVPGLVFAEGMGIVGPAIGENEAFGFRMTDGVDADEIAEFPFGPGGAGDGGRDADDGGIVLGEVDQDGAEKMVLIEREGMDDEKVAGVRAVIGPDADDVTGIQITEEVLAHIANCRGFNGEEQA